MENHMIQREAVLRQVLKGTLGEHRAQAGPCRDGDTAGLTWERARQAEGHSEFHSLIPASPLLSPAALVTLNEGRVFEQGL